MPTPRAVARRRLTVGATRRHRLLCLNLIGAGLVLPAHGYLLWHLLALPDVRGWWIVAEAAWGLMSLLLAVFLLWDHRTRQLEEDQQRVATAVTQTQSLGEKRLATLLSGTTDLVLVLDANGRVTYSSSASMQVLGFTQDGLRGRFIDALLTDEAGNRLAAAIAGMADGTQVRLDLMAVRGDGRHTPVEVAVTSHLTELLVGGYVVAIRDISHLERVTAELARQSQHDPLTTLPNRRLFNSQLAQALRAGTVGVIVADIDDFKSINTAFGHSVGDRVLVELANRLQQVIEPTDTLARLGGDEFAIILTGRSSVGMTAVANRVLPRSPPPCRSRGTRSTCE